MKKGLVSLLEQLTMSSDLWSVSFERTTGSKHDTVSITCTKVGDRPINLRYG